MERPIKYEIHKTKGAFQFKVAPAYSLKDKETGEYRPKGCVFVEAAPSTGERQYGFKEGKKVVIALGIDDISEILVGFKIGTFNITHDPNIQNNNRGLRVKRLSLWKGKQTDNNGLPTYFIKLEQLEKGNSEALNVMIPLTCQEIKVLSILLESSIPRILGWN